MKAYSEDLRTKILQAVDRGMPKSEAAKTFGVSRSSVKRYAAARREGRSLTPKKHPGSKPKLDQHATKILQADVEERPALTLKDRCRYLEEMVGVSVSESTLSRLLRKMGFSPKDGAWCIREGRVPESGLADARSRSLGCRAFRVRGRVFYEHFALANLRVGS